MRLTAREAAKLIGARARAKFGNKKTRGFASKKEAKRYDELRLLQNAGEISDLRTQVSYEIIPAGYDVSGKVIERSVNYIADFVYCDNKTAAEVVEDAKGHRTQVYIIKRKLMLFRHGIRVREV